ncbi:MAG: hypothetical protein M3N50_11725, partial [Pseudomonadota bacterium]|nr:hypothetical protein [Pseudomonadota bacterium]
MPPRSNAAFVVIQHLDRERKSLLPELLAKHTAMPVVQIEDGSFVKANHVYVIPPNTALTLNEDQFQLTPRSAENPHHPVDVFFASLAEARGDAAIGVVLSGGDSDGSLGIRSIKHAGGITFAQQPDSARVPSMPRSAIETGCVDFVLRPSGVAQELTRLGTHPYLRDAPGAVPELEFDSAADAEKEFRRIFRRLRSLHGVDFAAYKRSTLLRRLGRRMAVRKIEALSEYLKILEEEPAEAGALYRDFLIRVTSFFRYPQSFEALSSCVFPLLSDNRSAKNPIRLWVPGCATGEEVYSLAIALLEHLGDRYRPSSIQLFGTDVSETAIEKARGGTYLENITEEVSEERLRRFFHKHDGQYRIAKIIRDMCIFARHDVTRDPAFSRIDLVSCRNLFIYLDSTAQRRVMQMFHYSLRPQGFLVLGHSEGIGSTADLFEVIDKQERIYSRRTTVRAGLELDQLRELSPGSPGDSPAINEAHSSEIDSAQREADRVLLGLYAPASLLVDEQLNILQFRGETGPYIEHASGAPSLNLHRVVRPELLVELSPAIAEARESGTVTLREGLRVDERTNLTIRIIPLNPSSAHHCYLILFEDEMHRPAQRRALQPVTVTLHETEKDRRLARLERDLA